MAIWESRGNAQKLGAALTVLSRTEYWASGPVAALAAAERAVDVLGPLGPSTELAAALRDVARTHAFGDHHEEAIAAAAESRELATSLGEESLVSPALLYETSAQMRSGRPNGEANLMRSLELADNLGHAEYSARGCVNITAAMLSVDRIPEAYDIFRRGMAKAQDHELYSQLFRLRSLQSQLDLYLGNWEEAAGYLERMVTPAASVGIIECMPLAVLGCIKLRTGNDGAT